MFMKQNKKLLIATIAMFAIAPLAKGQDFSYTLQGGQTLYFNIADGNAVVTRPADTTLPYFSQLGSLVIPDTVEYNSVRYPVTAIDSNTFAECRGLTQITIPVTVTAMGRRAFDNVMNLTRTNYTGTLAQWCRIDFVGSTGNPISASGNLFVGGVAVTANSFTEDVSEIKRLTFAGCTSLVGTLMLPASITQIGYGAFYLCTGITSVELPSSVREIESHAFQGCSNLGSVNLPEGLEIIGDLAFDHCSGLHQVTIPRTIKDLGYNTFTNCQNLQTVWFNADSCNAGKAEGGLVYPLFGSSCPNLTSIIFGNNVKTIPGYAFAFCRHITEIVIPDSVVSIGKASFQTCDLLASVTIGENVASIGDSAFGWCGQLWRINMRGVTPPSYGFNAFKNIASQVEVNVPCEAVVEYENNAQWGRFDIVGKVMYVLTLRVDDEAHGSASVVEQATCTNPNATIKATPLQGYAFSHWDDGNTDNPRQVNLVQDTVFTAFFDVANGVEEAEMDGCRVYAQGRNIVVETNGMKTVSVTDTYGRMIAVANVDGMWAFGMPAAGVYLVQINEGKTIKKVVY